MDEIHQYKTQSKSLVAEDVRWVFNKRSKLWRPKHKKKPFLEWMVAGKTLWDWMQLLIIPFVLTVGGLLFSTYQHDADQQRALDQQQATVLQTYIDNIQDLLLNHNLRNSKPDDEVAIIARARTLTALQGLDSERKGRLLTFLHEADLIGYIDANGVVQKRVIDLYNANLSGADLTAADLTGANLSQVDLNGAYLGNADLTSADLSGVHLAHADLFFANLTNADLSQAILDDADLRYTEGLTQLQINLVLSCSGAILNGGLTCP